MMTAMVKVEVGDADACCVRAARCQVRTALHFFFSSHLYSKEDLWEAVGRLVGFMEKGVQVI